MTGMGSTPLFRDSKSTTSTSFARSKRLLSSWIALGQTLRNTSMLGFTTTMVDGMLSGGRLWRAVDTVNKLADTQNDQ